VSTTSQGLYLATPQMFDCWRWDGTNEAELQARYTGPGPAVVMQVNTDPYDGTLVLTATYELDGTWYTQYSLREGWWVIFGAIQGLRNRYIYSTYLSYSDTPSQIMDDTDFQDEFTGTVLGDDPGYARLLRIGGEFVS